jgi:Icc-related predicted phosphoesterase
MIRPEHLPAADILIHAGDFTSLGNPAHVDAFKSWVQELKIPAVVIAGNQDLTFDTELLMVFRRQIQRITGKAVAVETIKPNFLTDPQNIVYLENSATVVHGLKFWGSPCTPYRREAAFCVHAEDAAAHWAAIPSDTDVVVVHGPPFGTVDMAKDGSHAGCPELQKAIARTQPALVVSGHIHEAHGVGYIGDTLCLNASIFDRTRKPNNRPFLVDLMPRQRAPLPE